MEAFNNALKDVN